MSSFFLPAKRSSNDRKRKKTVGDKRRSKKEAVKKLQKRKKVVEDEEIASDSDIEKEERKPKSVNGLKLVAEDEEEEETAPEKRLRLAKEYIAQVEEEEMSKRDNADLDHDAIAHRLKEDVLEQAGKLQRQVADLSFSPNTHLLLNLDKHLPIFCSFELCVPDPDSIRLLKGHQLPVTCIVLTSDDHLIFSADKDGCIIKWDAVKGTKLHVFRGKKRRRKRDGMKREGQSVEEGHVGYILALAVSSDGTYLVSGGQDGAIHVWNAQDHSHLHTFTGHRDSVSGLVFQKGSHELFSCSFDRTVKIWNLDEMSYVETLFGHQDGVSAIDCLQRERPVTAGSNDRTVRVWKVIQESQLVFNGHKASIDCVRLINEEHFITGSQDGSIALWAMVKKKPLVKRAHSSEEEGEKGEGVGEGWVTAVAAFPNSDLVASGSSNGYVSLWKCGQDFRTIECCFRVALRGFVNCLQFAQSGDLLVAAVGQEHRLGRWWKDSSVRNSIALIPLPRTHE